MDVANPQRLITLAQDMCRKARRSPPLARAGSQIEEGKLARQGGQGQMRGPRRLASEASTTKAVTGKREISPLHQIIPFLGTYLKKVSQKEEENIYTYLHVCTQIHRYPSTATNRE